MEDMTGVENLLSGAISTLTENVDAERFVPVLSHPFGPDCVFHDCDRKTVVIDTDPDNIRGGRLVALCVLHLIPVALGMIGEEDVELAGPYGRVKLI